MGAVSSIEWTATVHPDGTVTKGSTWNPTRGCNRVGPECDNCYAMGIAYRFSGPGKPFEGLAQLRNGKADWTGHARLVPEMLAVPLRWRKPRRIFVDSMSDLFHHSLSNEDIAAVFGVMAACPQHTFQVLTKRPERMREWFTWASEHYDGLHTIERFFDQNTRKLLTTRWVAVGLASGPWPLPNVWLGTSVGNKAALTRVDELRECPTAVRFLSCEPLLEDLGTLDLRGIDWVIVGGESGPGARPCATEWIEAIVRQCKAAGVACFVKQLGRYPVGVAAGQFRSFNEWVNKARSWIGGTGAACFDTKGRPCAIGRDFMRARDEGAFPVSFHMPLKLAHKKGGDWSEWPERLRVREFPGVRT